MTSRESLILSTLLSVVSIALPSSLNAQLTLVEIGGAMDPGNVALAPDASPFAPDELDFGVHYIPNLNDGIYGNTNSWIGLAALPSFAGIAFDGEYEITSIAWGRDNGGEPNVFTDRSLGVYQVQYTNVANPDVETPEAAWTTIGEVSYDAFCPAEPWLRHRFNFPPVNATGVRLIVPATGIGGGTAIDEIEVYEDPGAILVDECVRPASLELVEVGGPVPAPLAPGDVSTLAEGNLARAPDAVAFGTPPHPAPVHEIAFVNDGLYGNSNSWLGNEPGAVSGLVYVGVYFADGTVTAEEVAFGRDNLEMFGDRAAGPHRVEYTIDDFDPNDDASVSAAEWTLLGVATDHVGSPRPQIRRRYRFDEVEVRAIRVVTALQNAIDELEIGRIEVDRGSPMFPPLELLETGGPSTTPAAIDDVPLTDEGNLALANTAVPFGSPVAAGREAFRVADGRYGDANSWLATNPGDTARPFVGIYFANGVQVLDEIAIGRDNTGARSDTTGGVYIVQTTEQPFVPEDPVSVASVTWRTIGQAEDHVGNANAGLRRRYALGLARAHAIRVLADEGAVIDEIELYAASTAGELVLVESGGVFADGNLATAPGALAFGSDELDFGGIHLISHVNDGVYGNANSWIGLAATPAFVGVSFGSLAQVESVAWGRDNTGAFQDRSLGLYLLQYTQVASPDASTPSSDWTTIGSVSYTALFPIDGSSWLRHRFNFDPVDATAVRLLVPGTGIGDGTCIDELEVYGEPGEVIEPPDLPELTLVEVGGPITTPSLPFDVPLFDAGNLANAPDAVAFGTPAHPDPAHEIEFLNDGFYGNGNSWLGNEAGVTSEQVYAGIAFLDGPRTVGTIAIGRDNTGASNDRTAGPYIVEYTVDALDAFDDASISLAEWTPIGIGIDHLRGEQPSGLRRLYSFDPIDVRAIRVVTRLGNAIDEIELGEGEPVAPGSFRRGDVDADGTVAITDAIALLGFLFLGRAAPPCLDAADADDDGALRLTDAIRDLNFLFTGGPPPAPPGPTTCGPDSGASLGCASYPPCE